MRKAWVPVSVLTEQTSGMEDEAQAETETEAPTDTEAPSDGCRPHRIIRSTAGSQRQQLTPEERDAKQKADKAERNANRMPNRMPTAKWP